MTDNEMTDILPSGPVGKVKKVHRITCSYRELGVNKKRDCMEARYRSKNGKEYQYCLHHRRCMSLRNARIEEKAQLIAKLEEKIAMLKRG
jgi:hypothetical protein